MKRLTLCAVLGALTFVAVARSAEITVLNPSFEADFAAPNSFPVLVPQNWSLYDPNGIVDNTVDAVGVLNPTGGTFFPGGAPHGTNVALIYLGGDIEGGQVGLSQTLTAKLTANTKYRLTVEVGNTASGYGAPPFDNFWALDGFPGYAVQLRANNVTLAQDLNSLSIAEGTFRTSVVEFTTGASHAQLGSNLQIRLINLNQRWSAANPGIEADFDYVRLDASPVPEPSSIFAVSLGAGLLIRRRRKNR